jgi:hypothetical protein
MQLTSLFEGKHSRPCFKNNCSLNTLSAGCHVQGTIVVIVLITDVSNKLYTIMPQINTLYIKGLVLM